MAGWDGSVFEVFELNHEEGRKKKGINKNGSEPSFKFPEVLQVTRVGLQTQRMKPLITANQLEESRELGYPSILTSLSKNAQAGCGVVACGGCLGEVGCIPESPAPFQNKPHAKIAFQQPTGAQLRRGGLSLVKLDDPIAA